jgi:acyl carrier protein
MADEDRQKEVLRRLRLYVREELVPEELKEGFDETTPLLESGILDSLKTAMLVNFARAELGLELPLERFEPETFQDVLALSAVLCESDPVPGG